MLESIPPVYVLDGIIIPLGFLGLFRQAPLSTPYCRRMSVLQLVLCLARRLPSVRVRPVPAIFWGIDYASGGVLPSWRKIGHELWALLLLRICPIFAFMKPLFLCFYIPVP